MNAHERHWRFADDCFADNGRQPENGGTDFSGCLLGGGAA